QHVRLRDPLPPADRRAVESEALVERALVEGADRQRHVLPRAEQVAELQVDHLRARLARPVERLARRRSGRRSVLEVVLHVLHLASFRRWPTKKEPETRAESRGSIASADAFAGADLPAP